jgi:RNA polymerase sigma-70 factor (ECF subfamily)
MPEETGIGGQSREFPSTRWTLIISSREGEESRRKALAELLESYWKPLYFYARRKGLDVEAAKDAIQAFFAHLLEREFLDRLDPAKGRFRSYLRGALDNFLVNLHEARTAQKRGGGARTVSLDFELAESELPGATEDAAQAYDREWALGVMERALRGLEREFASGARKGSFDVVRKFFQLGEPPPYAEAAVASGMSVPQFKAFLHRARTRFRELVRIEVSHTVRDGDDEAEMAELLKALR